MGDDAELGPNETARRLGVSVRALRLYERKGLIRPRRTLAGWRVYGQGEIERLHQVLTLRSLGLSLARIASLLKDSTSILSEVLALQEQALVLRKAEVEHALESIRAARAKLEAGETLSLDDITNLAREAAMPQLMGDPKWDAALQAFYRKRLTPEQYKRLRPTKAALQELGLTEESYDEAWRAVIGDATRLMERNDTASHEAAEVFQRWWRLIDVFTKGDEALQSGALLALFDALADPVVAAKAPVSEELLTFLQLIGISTAKAEQPPSDDDPPTSGTPRWSEDDIRRVIDDFTRQGWTAGLPPAPGLGPPPGLMKAIFAALGPLTKVRYLRADGDVDLHRVVFANGSRLLCRIAEDNSGDISRFAITPD